MATPDAQNAARRALERLTAMGVEARLMDGGHCALARMRVQPIPFATPTTSIRIDQVIFSTVGGDRIKCLKPLALFALPLIRIADCRDATAIEAQIRLAWKRHVEGLDQARDTLARIGIDAAPVEDGSLLSFPVEGDGRGARIFVADARRMILPGRGPLSGVALQRLEDRLMPIDPAAASAVELEIGISNRMEELVRMDRRLSEAERRDALTREPRSEEAEPTRARAVRLLLAGPRISREHKCIESLRLRGYEVLTASDERRALDLFDRCSPELAIADMDMGRNEGTSFVLALRQVTGIEEMPVVLVDETRRNGNREAARQVGAAGYLVYPIDIQRIAERLEALIAAPRRRRYTRYARRLPVEIVGSEQTSIVTNLGRGGMFVATDETMPDRATAQYRLSLPELRAHVSCEAEVVYRRGHAGRARGGLGVRFNAFDGRDESVLIEYLRTIDRTASASL